jgi:hypothetical protein
MGAVSNMRQVVTKARRFVIVSGTGVQRVEGKDLATALD